MGTIGVKIIGLDLPKNGLHYDLVVSVVSAVDSTRGGVQSGLWNSASDVYIGIIRQGCFAFAQDHKIFASYFAEKLGVDVREAEEIFKVLGLKNGEDPYFKFLSF